MTSDLDTTCRIPDPDSPGSLTTVRVMYENPRADLVYVIGVFRFRDDSEIDFKALPKESFETILEKCKEEVKKRNQQHQ